MYYLPCFLVVDIETTGYPPGASVIELGWHSVEPMLSGRLGAEDEPGYRFGTMSGSCLFGLNGHVMTPDNRAVHHISPAELEGLPPFDMAEWADPTKLGDVTHVVAHNSSFEEQFLDFGLPWICTYKCALHAWPSAPSHSNQALKYYLDVHDREDYYPPHRALPDAKVTAQILVRLLDRYTVEQLVEWTLAPRPIHSFPFGKHAGAKLEDIPLDYLEWVAGPKCEAARDDIKEACRYEVERRRMAASPFAALKEDGNG